MYKILITEPEYFPEDVVAIFKRIGNVVSKRLDRKQLLKEIKDVDVLVVRIETLVDKALLRNAKKLKVIATATTGIEHIDVVEAEKREIKIINLSGTYTLPTSEHTFALILSLIRRIPWAFENMKKGKWQRYRFFGKELEGKTLGVIGLGRIGGKVANYAKAFGMNVIAYDPYVNADKSKELNVELTSLENVLKNSDIITIHSMLTKETENMIGIKELKLMKRHAFLVNVARGRIVDEAALLKSLKDGLIAGAALDVYSLEPVENGNALVKYAKENDNLLLTPHIAASTEESIRSAAIYVAEKVKEIIGK
ncbi:MAG: hydroxyacid dehydrogenase [Candidatus Aenigmarchaeota archaeon]|nr:hydroxyacid dehydrogenase [Candidatus Aenigmarchaeota archaeon]